MTIPSIASAGLNSAASVAALEAKSVTSTLSNAVEALDSAVLSGQSVAERADLNAVSEAIIEPPPPTTEQFLSAMVATAMAAGALATSAAPPPQQSTRVDVQA
jgi:hypothetical protein